tara:strand:- start:61 stop:306 length:246 start_codon:yes stop_codon:yes gene_type:complete
MKKITLKIIIVLFSLLNFNIAYAETDCSNPKGFHQKLVCKAKGFDMKSSSDSENTSGVKKKVGGIWHKIKTFGGKNIGEEG